MKRLLFAVVVVAGFFLVVELILGLAGVRPLLEERDPYLGFSRQMQVFREQPAEGVLETRRRAVAHSFNYQRFKADKTPGGLRLFVLGGSSAYGFPWGARESFTYALGEVLAADEPGREVEAINAAAMSYGSHRLRILAHELLEYDPDLLVVYSGHNEFVEREFYEEMLGQAAPLSPLRATLFRWRLYSALSRLRDGSRTETAEVDPAAVAAGTLLGFDVDRKYATGVDAALRADVERQFEENLEAIVVAGARAGVPVVLCTVVSNLADWRPNDSTFGEATDAAARARIAATLRSGEDSLAAAAESALGNADAALALDGAHAQAHFLRARALEALGRHDEARAAFVLARDLDARPSRASSQLNEIVRRVAARHHAVLVDVERHFEQAVPHGLVGFNLLEDYVHPKPAGHRLIAFELWRALVRAGLAGEVRQPDETLFTELLGDPLEFDTSRTPVAEGGAATPALLYNLAVVLENQGEDRRAMEKYRECLALDPRHVVARFNLGRLLTRNGRYAEAVAEHRQSVEMDSSRLSSWIGLGEALRLDGRLDDAREAFSRGAQVAPNSAEPWNRLGVTLAQLNRHAEAESPLRRAVELAPDDGGAWVDLGYTLLLSGKTTDALPVFRRGLELAPGDGRARNGLGAALVEEGDFDEAEALFRESLRLDPADRRALFGLQELARRRDS